MMNVCPERRKMGLGSNATTTMMAVSWITLLLVLFLNLNLAASRRIPTTDVDTTVPISLGNNSHIMEKVPAYSKIVLKCPYENPIWFKNGEKLKVEIRRNKAIKFDKIKKTDAGFYSCRSEDNFWSNLTLSVLPGGEMKRTFANDMEIFSQVTENITEQHEHDETTNQDIVDDSEDYVDKEPVESMDSGASPSFKHDAKTLTRIVVKPSGSYVKIICAASGNPTPNITWTKDGESIRRSMGEVFTKKWTMSMEDVIPEDTGLYKCEICNIYGCIHHSTKIIIQDRHRARPIIAIGYPKNVTVSDYMTAEFECKMMIDLEPYITWVKHFESNSSIESSEENIKTKIKSIRNHLEPQYEIYEADPERPEVLRIENVTHANEGWYTCVAANSLGTSTASAYLRVTDEITANEILVAAPIWGQWATGIACTAVILFLSAAGILFFIMRKWKHEKLIKHRMETVHQWTKKVVIYKPASESGVSDEMIMPIIKIKKQRTTLLQNSNTEPVPLFNEYEFPLDSTWEIPRNRMILGDTLGEGAFGRVVMAQAEGVESNVKSTIVAVKMVKEGHTDSDMMSLVQEMEVMKMIGKHINIINLLGCCSQDGPLYVIVEFAPYGNLKDFLKSNKPSVFDEIRDLENKDRKMLTQKDLISFAFQVARGMEYLASRRCIHRDLAARNVLVSDDYVMKIADFGLARDLQDTDYYRKNTNGRLPIKWMAPESLQDKFYDTKSDVWSFGILLWEIMTFGDQPYPKVTAEELYGYLMEGNRMERPPRCSLNIYMLMRQCWNLHSDARPKFSEIVENLDKILTSTANANEEYLDLSVPLLETPPSSGDESDTETLRETLLRYH